MPYSQILYDTAAGICTITLNRPEKLNAFTGTMGDEIYDAFNVANADPDVKVIILSGSGTAFCAGVDMQALTDPKEGGRIVASPLLLRFPEENYRNAKATICAINGAAIGVGVTMSLSFDIRIADENARLAAPFAKLGMLPGLGSTHLLPQLMGRGRALDLLLSCRSLSAAEAHQMGLVERIAPAGTALDIAKEIAAALVKCNPAIITNIKAAVNFGSVSPLAQAIENEAELMTQLRASRASPVGKQAPTG